ncbi:MAG: hypothetical protein HOP17_04145 [Acidobacteria bacterium]|nr:hypothetical protein [Acidobacteriota bacterium]
MRSVAFEHSRSLERRIDAQRIRIEALSSLRETVSLPPHLDITKRQWRTLEAELKVVETRLIRRLKRGSRAYLAQPADIIAARAVNSLLGELELEMTRAFTFFDTFMDILTQRHTPELGRLLAGCDVLALDAIRKPHPALSIVEQPIVGCDRGFGAKTFREYVRFPGGGYNPMPLVQIPYSRLKEKYNLTSVLHEIGHEAMVRCGLKKALPQALRSGLRRAGAPLAVCDLFSLWSSEIGPDFWSFCGSGLAHAGAIKEILALPSGHAFRISWSDTHHPPYLRALMCFDWCRQVWGSGIWDRWEREWRDLYPVDSAPPATRDLVRKLTHYVPTVGAILLRTRFRSLNRKRIPDLFDLSSLAPSELKHRIGPANAGNIDLSGMPSSSHLAVFRLIKEQGKLNEESLDAVMTQWLLRLAERRIESH